MKSGPGTLLGQEGDEPPEPSSARWTAGAPFVIPASFDSVKCKQRLLHTKVTGKNHSHSVSKGEKLKSPAQFLCPAAHHGKLHRACASQPTATRYAASSLAHCCLLQPVGLEPQERKSRSFARLQRPALQSSLSTRPYSWSALQESSTHVRAMQADTTSEQSAHSLRTVEASQPSESTLAWYKTRRGLFVARLMFALACVAAGAWFLWLAADAAQQRLSLIKVVYEVKMVLAGVVGVVGGCVFIYAAFTSPHWARPMWERAQSV